MIRENWRIAGVPHFSAICSHVSKAIINTFLLLTLDKMQNTLQIQFSDYNIRNVYGSQNPKVATFTVDSACTKSKIQIKYKL